MFKKRTIKAQKSGFTLLEILLVVATIAILAGIVIQALNPAKQLANTRNAQRRSDVNSISNAVYQYMIDNNGDLPGEIAIGQTEICQTGAVSCSGLVNLSVLTNSQKYLVSIPTDPTGISTYGAGYEIYKSGNNRVTVVAPDAEQSQTISVTR